MFEICKLERIKFEIVQFELFYFVRIVLIFKKCNFLKIFQY